jgi:hypothetical protein
MCPANVAEPVKWLGETVGFWVQTGIFLVSAIGGIWIIRARGSQEKRRATVDLVLQQKRDTELSEARHLVTKMHIDGEPNLAKHIGNPDSPEFKAILLVLNTHEFVASGIRSNALDEHVYKRLRFSTLRKDWDGLCGFILEFRRVRASKTLYQDFQWLNDRWENCPLKADHPSPTSI